MKIREKTTEPTPFCNIPGGVVYRTDDYPGELFLRLVDGESGMRCVDLRRGTALPGPADGYTPCQIVPGAFVEDGAR